VLNSYGIFWVFKVRLSRIFLWIFLFLLTTKKKQNKESRQNSKSPSVRKANRKKQQQPSANTRTKKSNNKVTVSKSSFIKTSKNLSNLKTIKSLILFKDINGGTETNERRSTYSPPNKILHITPEVCFYRKKNYIKNS